MWKGEGKRGAPSRHVYPFGANDSHAGGASPDDPCDSLGGVGGGDPLMASASGLSVPVLAVGEYAPSAEEAVVVAGRSAAGGSSPVVVTEVLLGREAIVVEVVVVEGVETALFGCVALLPVSSIFTSERGSGVVVTSASPDPTFTPPPEGANPPARASLSPTPPSGAK